jgi:chemotaxis protein CheC
MTATPALSDLQRDALKEIGNIGAGHAATALSQLLNTRIGLVEPQVDVLPLRKLTQRIDRPNRRVAALQMDVRGEAPGQIIVLFDRDQASEFVKKFIKRVIGEITIYDSIAESTLKELGNIVAGSYLSAIVTLTGVRLEPSVPQLSYGSVEDAVGAFAAAHPERPVFLVESVFLDGDATIGGEFVFVPEHRTMKALFTVFGV